MDETYCRNQVNAKIVLYITILNDKIVFTMRRTNTVSVIRDKCGL